MAIVNGWGRGTWGEGAWGSPISVTLTAPSAATASTTDPTNHNYVSADANVTPTGQAGTSAVAGVGVNAQAVATLPTIVSSVGTPTVVAVADANVTIDASGDTFKGLTSLGTLGIDAEANVIPTGQSATSAVGGVGVNGKAVVALPTLVSSVGTPSVLTNADANVTPTGQAGTSALGTATTKTDNRFEIIIPVNAVSSVGTLSFNAKATVTLTGVSASGLVGSPFKWQKIDDSQTPNWEEIAA